jgi:heme d1 biosynthesis radical SAM protein NirJ
MFRISHYLSELLEAPKPQPSGPLFRTTLPGPVVIWNLIRRCNLNCLHCYTTSADINFPGELSTDEVFRVLQDLKEAEVRVLILSGGEPLLRADLLEIAAQAKAMGFYVGLSSNGTLMDSALAKRIGQIGFDYVGISIDGLEEAHDRFRRVQGSFRAAMQGLEACQAEGIKVGLRFTLTQANAPDLPALLDLMEERAIDKFYLSHLNYGGRGHRNRKEDAEFQLTRTVMEQLFTTCLRRLKAGHNVEFVTGNNDADGPFLLQWITQHYPAYRPQLEARLKRWGGNASGVNIANIDNLGHVHPDTFWWHYGIGNVRTRPFKDIWNDVSDPLMAGLKANPRPLKGRCATCDYVSICNGNTRVRAHQLTGDAWAEDPGCYLTDEEIGSPSYS